MFCPDSAALYQGGGPYWLKVQHPDGTDANMGVDVGIVQEACLRLDNQCQSANCDLWKAIKELRERLAKFRQVPQQYYRPQPARYVPGAFGSGRGQGRQGAQYRRVGGEGEAPKKTSKTRRFGVLPLGSARATEPAF
eukprot:gene7134-biopygen4649